MTIVWPAADFSPLLQGGIPRNNSLRTRENQFGGGYRAAVPEGLNQVAMKVTFSVVTNENVPGQKLIDLETLIQQGKGTEPYSIRFAGEQSDRLVTIKNWTPNARSPWVHFVSIDAESFNEPASLLASVPGAYRLSYTSTVSSFTGLVYSQSSIFNPTVAATVANMNDSNPATGAGTNNAIEWIQADFNSTLVNGCILGGSSSLPGWGSVAPYLNGANIEAWVSGAWVVVSTVSGVTDTGVTAFKTFSWAPVQTNKLRIAKSGYLSTTEFQILAVPLSNPPTYPELQDGSPTGFATLTANATLVATLPSQKKITHVGLEASTVAGFGPTAAYLNGAQIQTSPNGVTWTTQVTISGMQDFTLTPLYFPIASQPIVQYVRILGGAAGLGLSRFELWGKN